MSLSFPSDLLQAREYVCQISALKPLNTLDQNLRGRIRADAARADGGVEIREVASSIYLPIPVNMTQGAQEHEIDTQANLLGALGDSIQNIVNLARTVGAAVQRSVNIGHYIVYQAPKFKQTEFTWVFMPRNEAESRTIRDMVKWISYYSSPSRGSGIEADVSVNNARNQLNGLNLGQSATNALNSITFEYPNEFRINYLRIVDGNPKFIFTPIPKTGFIEKLEINYFDEEGTPTSFFRGTEFPTVTTIKFTLQENELTVRSDFADAAEYADDVAAAEQLETVTRGFSSTFNNGTLIDHPTGIGTGRPIGP